MKDVLSPARSLESETEAAIYLGISPRTLQAWRGRGDGPAFVKVGRAVRYDRAALDAFIAERTRTNTVGGAA
ncbi:DNA-binding protein [Lamprobacter modestohalophilus]|uniref:DNA-binding protein n=1 Tax=Lamprobacter modestohalophilus TaxID=1064514 RepID=A0A9X0WE23_9GAMM|nr:helix-turn-helix domain-containing protein [Lamprobacter modestohalophilus]MBK1621711.1 DNA-binding protein [Lamprobacter modestohalophilus]